MGLWSSCRGARCSTGKGAANACRDNARQGDFSGGAIIAFWKPA
jgi:hypothetical protein